MADLVVALTDYLQNYNCKLENIASLLINEAATNMLRSAVCTAWYGARCCAGNEELVQNAKSGLTVAGGAPVRDYIQNRLVVGNLNLQLATRAAKHESFSCGAPSSTQFRGYKVIHDGGSSC